MPSFFPPPPPVSVGASMENEIVKVWKKEKGSDFSGGRLPTFLLKGAGTGFAKK